MVGWLVVLVLLLVRCVWLVVLVLLLVSCVGWFGWFSWFGWFVLVGEKNQSHFFSQASEVETWLRKLPLNKADDVVQLFTEKQVFTFQSLCGAKEEEIEAELLEHIAFAD